MAFRLQRSRERCFFALHKITSADSRELSYLAHFSKRK